MSGVRFAHARSARLKPDLAHVEKQRQPQRDTDSEVRRDRNPQLFDLRTAAFDEHKHPKHDRRHDHIGPEKGSNGISKQPCKQEWNVEAMLLEEGKKLPER